MALLEIEGLSKHFGGLLAINDLAFDVREGMILGIIGPNGAGKTTLYNLITGVYRPSKGRIRFDGQDITAIVGDATTRHAQFEIPRSILRYPGFTLPDTGSIPVSFTGTAFETDFAEADELTVSFI